MTLGKTRLFLNANDLFLPMLSSLYCKVHLRSPVCQSIIPLIIICHCVCEETHTKEFKVTPANP